MQLQINARFINICLFLILLSYTTLAQKSYLPQPRCGTNEVNNRLRQRYPQIAKLQEQAQLQAKTYQKQKKLARLQQPVIVIPVVFHVVYHGGQENISNDQLLSQIEVLNIDYRRRNSDSIKTLPQFKGVAADTRIQFCLATRDPNGNPTTGITRKYTPEVSFDMDDAVKFNFFSGQDAWPRNRYLNIWVCNLSGDNLGYSQYPGGPANTDGVVLDYVTIGRAPANPFPGPYDLGRTGTHEVGHWLGLQHNWGPNDAGCDDSDDIEDTPNQDDATTGCPSGTVVSCNNSPLGDMYQNYLDYTNDACMNLFTRGQAEYMQSVLSTSRQSILTTAVVCRTPLTADFEASDTIVVAGTAIQFQDASIGVQANAWNWTFEGGNLTSSTDQNPEVVYDQPGKYSVSLTVSLGSVSDAVTKTRYIRVTSAEAIVYPNPAKQTVTIEAPANKELMEIQVFNSVGQIVMRQQTKINIVTLQLPNVAAGLYHCQLVYKDGTRISKKLVITR